MYRIVTLEEPNIEPVDLSLTKQHIRVDIDEDDALINFYIKTARRFCEYWCNRSFITQTKGVWYDYADLSRSYIISLPIGPAQSILSIETYNEAGVPTVIDNSDSYLAGDRVIFKNSFSYPTDMRSVDSLLFSIIVGYGADAQDVPADIREAILLLVGHMYQNREAQYDSVNGAWTKNVPFSVTAMLQPYREYYL